MSAWPWGRASIQLWPPGTQITGERAMAANSSAVCPGVMRSKQPHSLRIGICWAARWRTSLRWSTPMSMLPTGQRLGHGADVLAHVGQDGPHGGVQAADGEVGQVEDDRRDHVDHRARCRA